MVYCTVSISLNCKKDIKTSVFFINNHRFAHLKRVLTIDYMSVKQVYTSNYNFGFVVEENFELGYTIKYRCFDT